MSFFGDIGDSVRTAQRALVATAVMSAINMCLLLALVPMVALLRQNEAALGSGADGGMRLNGGGVFRASQITLPDPNTYAGIEAMDHLRYEDNVGWRNPLMHQNTTWMLDPRYVLAFPQCLSRALRNEGRHGHYQDLRVSLCYFPQQPDGSGVAQPEQQKVVDVRQFLRDEQTGNLKAGLRGIRLNEEQFGSLLDQQHWISEWFRRSDLDLEQLRRSLVPITDVFKEVVNATTTTTTQSPPQRNKSDSAADVASEIDRALDAPFFAEP